MAELLSYALTNLSDVKESLGIASGNTTKDNLIIRKINQATEMIERYCGGRRFKATDYNGQEYDSTNSDQLILKQYPVNTFTILEYRDSVLNDNSWDTVEADAYFVDTDAGVIDLLFVATGKWNQYRATYNAGYQTIPADLAEACVTLACYLVDNAQSGTGVKSRQEGARKIEYFDPNGNSKSGSTSIFDQLSIDETLDSYSKYPVQEK